MCCWVFFSFAVERSSAEMQWLLGLVQTDPSHYVRLVKLAMGWDVFRAMSSNGSTAKFQRFCPIRHKILSMLCKNPPFTKAADSALCNEALVDQLWKLMNSGETHPHKFSCTNEPNISCYSSKRPLGNILLSPGTHF